MAYFPFYIDLVNKNCYIIGGGNIAYRKLIVLLEYGAKITLISNDISAEIWAFKNEINIINKKFEINDIIDPFYVICATDDENINTIVSNHCLINNILVNVVDDVDKCNFIFPAVYKQGDVVIGVSTSGNSPTMAGHIRDLIRESIPSYYIDLISKLGSIREKVKLNILTEKKRAKALKKITHIGLENNGEILDDLVCNIIKEVNEEINE